MDLIPTLPRDVISCSLRMGAIDCYSTAIKTQRFEVGSVSQCAVPMLSIFQLYI